MEGHGSKVICGAPTTIQGYGIEQNRIEIIVFITTFPSMRCRFYYKFPILRYHKIDFVLSQNLFCDVTNYCVISQNQFCDINKTECVLSKHLSDIT